MKTKFLILFFLLVSTFLNAQSLHVRPNAVEIKDSLIVTKINTDLITISQVYDTVPTLRFEKAMGGKANPLPTITNDTLGKISFRGYDEFQYSEGANIASIVDGDASGSIVPSSLTFSTASFIDGSINEHMKINSAGYVGMGTLTPEYKLHVNGDMAIERGRLLFPYTGYSIHIGEEAGINSDLSSDRLNVFIGPGAGKGNTTGFSNVYIGINAGNENQLGDSNVAIGEGALSINTKSANTAIGKFALAQNINGRENFALGNYAGYDSDGDQNIFIGSGNGESMTGSGNIFIGNEVGVNQTSNGRLKIHNTSTTTPLIDGDFTHRILKINGSLEVTDAIAKSIKTDLEAGTDHPNHTSSIWIYNMNVGVVNLPLPGSCIGRSYTIVNKSASGITFSMTYKNMSNAEVLNLPISASITIVSDGSDWHQIH